MIPKIEPVRHVTNVTSEAIAYTVTMTPTLAKILSSQTYTDKILAAIREPLSNAYDSHVRAKATRPAEIHLPTQLEPWFAVRDYGTGLTHENVVRLFFSYNVSDKHGTNDEIGGLGIGAKAFYAYTDVCTITVWHEGEVRRYAATKDMTGLPQGQLVETAYTDQDNGVEIRYPVSPYDFSAFQYKTERVLEFLGLNYTCNKTLEIRKATVFFSAEIGDCRVDRLINGSESALIMGGIAYSIPHDVFWDHAKSRTGKVLSTGPLHIHMPIGSVEVSASRESLSPTQADKDKLIDLFLKFREAMQAADWDEHVGQADGWLQACRLRNGVVGIVGIPKKYRDNSALLDFDYFPWRGIRTLGDFEYESTHPVVAVWNKGQKVDRYVTQNFGSSFQSWNLKKVFWIPSKVNWKSWYMANRSMYKDRDYDLHIRTATMEEAIKIADLIQPGIEVLDGTQIHTKPVCRKKSSAPTPSVYKGLAWVGISAPTDISRFNQEYLILSNAANHNDLHIEVSAINSLGLFPHPIQVFRPYGLNEKTAAARFPDYPVTVDAWLYRHRDELDRAKLIQLLKQRELRSEWKSDWIDNDVVKIIPPRLKFPFPSVSYIEIPQKIRNLARRYPGIAKEKEAIEKWHQTVLPPLPAELKLALNYRHRHFSTAEVFNMYQTLGGK